MDVRKIYTDGSGDYIYGKKQGVNTAGIGVFFGDSDSRNFSQPYNGNPVTHNRAEIYAVIKAIELLKPDEKNVVIYSDSEYTIKSINQWLEGWIKRGWRKSDGKQPENRDLWEMFLEKDKELAEKGYKIKYEWIRAHQKEPAKGTEEYAKWYGNSMADKLAVEGRFKS